MENQSIEEVVTENQSIQEAELEKWDVFVEELKKVSSIAAPMVTASILQYMLQVVTMIMVGHLGHHALSSVAIATSLTNVFGFSLISGLVGGMETLCGQAYGAKQYHKLGIYLYTAIISLMMVCVPLCVVWSFMDKLLILIKQDPSISHEVRKYSIPLIPALFADAISKPLVRYLQTQSVILPMLLCSFVILLSHTFASWLLIYKIHLGIVGGAMTFCISNWLEVVILSLYVKFSASCKDKRVGFSVEAFHSIVIFFRLAIPSAVMVCLKWWSFELIILLCVLLPNPELETSVLSICLTISTLQFTIPYGLGVAASTRVANELGAEKPNKAKTAASVVIFLAVVEVVTIIIPLFCLRHILGRAFSNQKQVVDYFATIAPFLCISIITDGLQAVISEIARGSGWQNIGAFINLGAFYLVGIPLALVLGLALHLKTIGFWIGIVIGSVIQATTLSLVTFFTNWQYQATKARDKLSQDNGDVENNTVETKITGRRGDSHS